MANSQDNHNRNSQSEVTNAPTDSNTNVPSDSNTDAPTDNNTNVPSDSNTNVPSENNSQQGEPKVQSPSPEETTNAQSSRRRPLSRSLTVWSFELWSLLLSIASFFAIIVLLRVYKDSTLSEWKLPISINAVVAILSAVFKGSLAPPLTEGISQLKWIWFSSGPKSLADMDPYDQASRGAIIGSVTLIARQFAHRNRSFLVALGALLLMITLAIDPFTQASVDFYSCLRPSVSPASIPRAGAYTTIGAFLGYDEASVDIPMLSAIYLGYLAPPDNTSTSVEVTCGTGNCTFPSDEGATFTTTTMCYECQDLTDRVIKGDLSYRIPGSDDEDEDFLSLSTSVLFNVSSDRYYDWPHRVMSEISGLTFKYANPKCDEAEEDCEYEGLGFTCAFTPCMKTFAANFTNNRYHEEELSTEYLNYNPQLENYVLGVDRTLVNGTWQDCNPTDEKTKTNTEQAFGQDVEDLERGQNTSSTPSKWYPPECFHVFGAYAQAAVAQSISGFFHDENLQWSITPRANSGAVWLQTLWDEGRIDMSSVNDYAAGIAMSVGAQMRMDPSNEVEAFPVGGQSFATETCIEVRWAFLSFIIVLLALELLFFGGVMVVNHRAPWDGDWKSSSLAPLFHGLGDGGRTNSIGAPLATSKTMLAGARPMKAQLVEGDEGWRLATTN